MTAPTPTPIDQHPNVQLWASYQFAFDHFNEHLFGGILPSCVLTFNCRGNSHGVFKSTAWSKPGESFSTLKTFHEIALNPKLLKRPDDLIFQTLARLMVNLWQQVFGKPPGMPDYCDREFTQKMAGIGLPCDSANGRRVPHIVAVGGKYALACPEAMQLYFPLQGILIMPEKPIPKRLKYLCPTCSFSALAPGNGKLICMTNTCNTEMVIQKPDEQ